MIKLHFIYLYSCNKQKCIAIKLITKEFKSTINDMERKLNIVYK